MNCNKLCRVAVCSLMAVTVYMYTSNRIDASTVINDARHWDISQGSLYIDPSTGGNSYVIQGSVRDSDNHISVQGRNVKLILDNVDIDTGYLVAPIELENGATVTLELIGKNKISGDYGILVNQGSTLNIIGEGSLDISADSSAAIGNVMYNAFGLGDINIKGGEIYAKSNFGSAIGTCEGVDQLGSPTIGNISITGGYIEACGSMDSAAIGAGKNSKFSNIYIGGDAVVKALGSDAGAGIGGGLEEGVSEVQYGQITIADNATVEAYSYCGAGIGSGVKDTEAVGTVNVEVKGSASVYSESQWGEAIGNGASRRFKEPVEVYGSIKTASSVEQGVKEDIEDGQNNISEEAIDLISVNNQKNIKLIENSNISCVSYFNEAVTSDVDSDIVIMNFEEIPMEDTEIELTSDNGTKINIEVPSMCKSIATKLDKGQYICEVSEEGLELDETSKETFNPVVEAESGKVNSVKIVNAAEVLPETVYVDNLNGNNANTGFNSEKAIKDFDKAYSRVATNGKIVVCGKTEIESDIDKRKHIEITSKTESEDYREQGAELVVDFDEIEINDSVKLASLNINMMDSNIKDEQLVCLSAEDTKFSRVIDSRILNTNDIIQLADTKTELEQRLDRDSYLVCWSSTSKVVKDKSLRSQILCMSDKKSGIDR